MGTAEMNSTKPNPSGQAQGSRSPPTHARRVWPRLVEQVIGEHMRAFTLDELLVLPAMIDLSTAAQALGIGRGKAYELVRQGKFPCRVLRIGHSYRVPTADPPALHRHRSTTR